MVDQPGEGGSVHRLPSCRDGERRPVRRPPAGRAAPHPPAGRDHRPRRVPPGDGRPVRDPRLRGHPPPRGRGHRGAARPLGPAEPACGSSHPPLVVPVLRAGLGHARRRAAPPPRDGHRLHRPGPQRGDLRAGALHELGARRPRRPARARPRPDAGHRWLAATTPAGSWRRATPERSRRCACWPRPRASSDLAASGLVEHLVTASIDSHLNERAYIVPGLGDAGDRLFGTA